MYRPMRTMRFLFAAACAAALALGAIARADVTATVLNGQKISGLVFKEEDVRLVLPLAAGATGKLKFIVSGWRVPVSFSNGEGSQILDPDGQAVTPGDDLVFGPQTIDNRRRRSIFRIDRLLARKTGNYTLVLKTNTLVTLKATGKWKVTRPKFETFEGDETSGDFPLELQQGESVRIKLKTGDGDPPLVSRFILTDGSRFPPQQKFNKKGSKTIPLPAQKTGSYGFQVGYQVPGVEGSYTGKVIYKVVKGLGVAQLRRSNPPGVVLSVLPSERFLDIDFGDAGVGIASPFARTLTITSERNGELLAKAFKDDLTPLLPFSTAVPVLTQSDLQPGQTFAGHRMIFVDGAHIATYSTVSGTDFGLVRFNTSFQVTAIREFKVNSPISTQDAFLVQNKAGDGVFVGLLTSPAGHTVTGFDGQFNTVSSSTIGVGGLAHRNGAGVQWNAASQLFELWAPDSLVPGQPSDLHRQFYTQTWVGTGLDQKPIADANLQETMPTALSIDSFTGATILHYVVVRNPNSGAGEIHRRVYQPDGQEIPGSHVVLSDGLGAPYTDRNRPISAIVGNNLFLGYETSSGPRIERFPILR